MRCWVASIFWTDNPRDSCLPSNQRHIRQRITIISLLCCLFWQLISRADGHIGLRSILCVCMLDTALFCLLPWIKTVRYAKSCCVDSWIALFRHKSRQQKATRSAGGKQFVFYITIRFALCVYFCWTVFRLPVLFSSVKFPLIGAHWSWGLSLFVRLHRTVCDPLIPRCFLSRVCRFPVVGSLAVDAIGFKHFPLLIITKLSGETWRFFFLHLHCVQLWPSLSGIRMIRVTGVGD